METLGCHRAQEALDDHLVLSERCGAAMDIEGTIEGDMRRNVSEDIVVHINRGAFRGHDG